MYFCFLGALRRKRRDGYFKSFQLEKFYFAALFCQLPASI
uniref:Uncharacterized protein n=1 Tax=Arundo donax TaxID=35708 RepID=A0A0A9HMN0_ARUDO